MAERIWTWLIKEASFLRKINNATIRAKIVEHDRATTKRLRSLPTATAPVEREVLRGGRTHKPTVDGQIEELN